MREAEKLALDKLVKRDGTLSVSAVIAEAHKPGSPLHKRFEWDKNKAATLNWMHVARNIMREYTVVVVVEDTTRTVNVKAFVHDPAADGNESRYKSTAAIKSRSREAKDVLLTEAHRCKTYLESCANLADYWSIDASELRCALQELDGFIDRVGRVKKSSTHKGKRRHLNV